MRIEDLKRWHWVIIGLFVGVSVSLWRGSIDAETALTGRSTLDGREFQRMLQRETRDGQPMLRDVRVYPVGDGEYWVAAEQLRRRGRGRDLEERYIPVKVRAITPFVVWDNTPVEGSRSGGSSGSAAPPAGAVDASYTVIDYLKSVQAKNPGIDFSTRWWDAEPLRTTFHAAGGVVLIGGIWPSIIRLLIGAGFGKRSEKKEPEYDLSRFGKGTAAATTAAQRSAATPQDIDKLRALEAELEKNLSAGNVGASSSVADAPPAPAHATSEAPIRKLTGGPVEVAAPDQPREEKEYAGEYYPTVTHVKHK